jgi:hypothetical protein
MHSIWENPCLTPKLQKQIINLEILETKKLHKSCKKIYGNSRNGARDST